MKYMLTHLFCLPDKIQIGIKISIKIIYSKIFNNDLSLRFSSILKNISNEKIITY